MCLSAMCWAAAAGAHIAVLPNGRCFSPGHGNNIVTVESWAMCMLRKLWLCFERKSPLPCTVLLHPADRVTGLYCSLNDSTTNVSHSLTQRQGDKPV